MYVYEELRPKLFTDEGQRLFLRVRDHAAKLIEQAGAARLDKIVSKESGDSWLLLACVDRLVELGEIREISLSSTFGQHRVFCSGTGR